MMGEAIEQRGRHLWIAEHARPFAEGEIGGDDDRSSLVEPADEIQQLPAGLSEGEIAEFVEDDEVEAREVIGEPSLAAARDSASSWFTRSTVVKKRLSIGTQKGTPYRRPKRDPFRGALRMTARRADVARVNLGRSRAAGRLPGVQ